MNKNIVPALAIGATGAAAFFGYKYFTYNKLLKQMHDNINKLPVGITVPSNVIPADLLKVLNGFT